MSPTASTPTPTPQGAPRAIVTGHTQGIGRAVAQALSQQGVPVLGLSRRSLGPGQWPATAATVEEAILDLADSAALQAWLKTPALARFLAGAEQALLVNNAGTVEPVAACGRQGAERIARAVALNVTAPLVLSDAFVAATAAVSDRRIVHLSSGAARNPYAGWSVYCATKAALDLHARSVQEDALAGLKIASLAPGVVDTAMQSTLRASDPKDFPLRPRFDALKADGALATPEAVAQQLVAWLLSPDFGEPVLADLRTLGSAQS